MKDCFLPAPEETLIRFNFTDGQEPLVVDAIDMMNLIDSVRIEKIPEDSTLETEIAQTIQKQYNRKVSRTAAGKIWDITFDVMESVKKKLYLKPDFSAGIPTPDSPPENSPSSNG